MHEKVVGKYKVFMNLMMKSFHEFDDGKFSWI